MVLYLTRSHSFLSSGELKLQSGFQIKGVAGKCNPWLHVTPQQGLALGDRSGKISTPGCGPLVPLDLYSTQEGHPSWFPLVSVLGDMGLFPGD